MFYTPGEKFDCAIHACSWCGVAINRFINFCGGRAAAQNSGRPYPAEACTARGAAAAGGGRETEANASAAAADRKKIFPVSLIELAYLDRLVSILILAGLFSFSSAGRYPNRF